MNTAWARWGPPYASGAQAAVTAGAELILDTRYLGGSDGQFEVTGPDGPMTVLARFVVGADGARSRVARDLGLDRKTHLLVVAEDVFTVSEPVGSPAFRCALDPRLAPGHIGWVINDGTRVQVGTAGYSRRFTGLGPCLRLSDYAADALDEALRTGKREALRDYDGGALRRKFTGRLMMRHALPQAKHPWMTSVGFEALRRPFGRVAARKVLL